ncbi:heterokaryon incompatibility protein-domain-containing protein [Exophiala viscosa]|uniref:Heterokaryon incompatibility protein-domain-containing protein n=1 Tax=Exophiala viscosa TaxID=2486360 RepID=A0AAN6DM32_9EURO|nr:heterokaryon incompatibility protein-domain-containing protein [Exophiala viscosa]KAI1620962.1 heterokaryon incompatibility protein-domain-containing protein [Exophiala viscosa]
MELYVWSELAEPGDFRLLYLQGWDSTAAIICSLIPASIAKPPSYCAISHCWGKRDLTHAIVCDGKRLPITAAVHALFAQIQKSDDLEKTIWIDAVCINQDSPEERAQQVLLMKDIFSKAQLTIVYFGEPERAKDVPAMLELGDKIIEMARKTPPKHLKEEDLVSNGLPSLGDTSWTTLANFFCLPWFNRVWIVQEYVLANVITFLYGEHWIPHEYIISINRTFSKNEDSYNLEELLRPLATRPKQTSAFWNNDTPTRWLGISQKISQMEYFRSMRKLNIDYQKWALRMLTSRSSSTEATDRRDYIFGMLGLLPIDAANHPDLQPDYNAPDQHAYTKLARFILETKGLASLLSSTGFPRRTIKGAPSGASWVPDWSTQRLSTTIHRQAMLTIPSKFGQDNSAPWRLDKENIPQKLYVRCIVWDSIDRVDSLLARALAQPGINFAVCQVHFTFDTLNLMMESGYADEGPAALALRHMRTLCLSNPPKRGLGPGYLTVSELEDASKVVAPRYDFNNLAPLLTDAGLQTQTSQVLGRLYISDQRLGFALTQLGRIGRVPHEAKKNDKICFFQGIDIPFVVRETGPITRQFSLIDHCYIDGEMDGSFWQRHDDQKAQEICLV